MDSAPAMTRWPVAQDREWHCHGNDILRSGGARSRDPLSTWMARPARVVTMDVGAADDAAARLIALHHHCKWPSRIVNGLEIGRHLRRGCRVTRNTDVHRLRWHSHAHRDDRRGVTARTKHGFCRRTIRQRWIDGRRLAHRLDGSKTGSYSSRNRHGVPHTRVNANAAIASCDRRSTDCSDVQISSDGSLGLCALARPAEGGTRSREPRCHRRSLSDRTHPRFVCFDLLRFELDGWVLAPSVEVRADRLRSTVNRVVAGNDGRGRTSSGKGPDDESCSRGQRATVEFGL